MPYGDGLVGRKSDRTVQCLDPEDKCINYIGRIRDPGNVLQETISRKPVIHRGPTQCIDIGV